MTERRDRIVVREHDPAWAASFAQQREALTPALAAHLVRPIEHIGSTAVPGLPAKPIVDMLAVVRSYDEVDPVGPILAAVGWVLAPEPGDEERRRWSLCHPTVEQRTHHLHVVEETSAGWPTWLAFRDHLRTHPGDREEYARIKRDLAAADDRDRAAYRSGKAPFIERVLGGLAR